MTALPLSIPYASLWRNFELLIRCYDNLINYFPLIVKKGQ